MTSEAKRKPISEVEALEIITDIVGRAVARMSDAIEADLERRIPGWSGGVTRGYIEDELFDLLARQYRASGEERDED